MSRPRKIPLYPVAPDRAGAFLYLFLVKVGVDTSKEKHLFKVGFSRNLAQRHRTLTTGVPDDAVQLLAAGWFAEGVAMESHILQMLDGARQEREIATLTTEERAYLVRYLMSGQPNYLAPTELYDPNAAAVPLPVATRPEQQQQGGAVSTDQQPAPDPAIAIATIDHAIMATVERSLRAEYDRARIQDWYIELRTFRAQVPGCLIAVQRGRRYVFMDEDATLAAAVLNMPVASESVTEGTVEERSRHRRPPAVFLDADDFDRHLAILTTQGMLHVVQVVEQTSDEQARSLRSKATRAIARISTPATADGTIPGLLVSAISEREAAALSGYDPLSGEWFVGYWDGPHAVQHLLDTIDRLSPVEILVPDDPQLRPGELTPILEMTERGRLVRDASERNAVELLYRVFGEGQALPVYRIGRVTVIPGWRWDISSSSAILAQYLGSRNPLHEMSTKAVSLARKAAAVIPRYLTYTQMAPPSLDTLRVGGITGTVALDRATRRNLELLVNTHGGTAGTLLRTIDKTMTRMGSRALKAQLLNPVREPGVLNSRFDAIDSALRHTDLLLTLRDLLGRLGDLDHLAQRVASGRPRPGELMQLRAALVTAASINDQLSRHSEGSVILQGAIIDPCHEIVRLLDTALADVPVWPAEPIASTLGCYQLMRLGYDPALDQLVADYVKSEEAIATWTEIVRADFRQVCATADGVHVQRHPNYGPVIVAPAKLVPPLDYVVLPASSHQPGQAFYTNAQLALTGPILATVPERVQKAEITAYQRLCSTLVPEARRLRATARVLATLDVTISNAVYARAMHAVRPVMTDEPIVQIRGGRHPTVERTHIFVANDVALDGRRDDSPGDLGPSLMLITGPNASGKSTVMRQTALIILMSHCGLFVPATQATIGLVDGIYSRIGAQDDLVQARSTFQYEMDEIAHIIAQATARSFVILDEVGRGTDARNGGAVAVGTIKYLDAINRCIGMIATHHHHIVPLVRDLPRLQCWQMLADLTEHSITYTYRLAPGAAAQSYALHLLRSMNVSHLLWQLAEQAYADLSSETPARPGDAFSRARTLFLELSKELQGRRVAELPFADLVHYIERLQAFIDVVEGEQA